MKKYGMLFVFVLLAMVVSSVAAQDVPVYPRCGFFHTEGETLPVPDRLYMEMVEHDFDGQMEPECSVLSSDGQYLAVQMRSIIGEPWTVVYHLDGFSIVETVGAFESYWAPVWLPNENVLVLTGVSSEGSPRFWSMETAGQLARLIQSVTGWRPTGETGLFLVSYDSGWESVPGRLERFIDLRSRNEYGLVFSPDSQFAAWAFEALIPDPWEGRVFGIAVTSRDSNNVSWTMTGDSRMTPVGFDKLGQLWFWNGVEYCSIPVSPEGRLGDSPSCLPNNGW